MPTRDNPLSSSAPETDTSPSAVMSGARPASGSPAASARVSRATLADVEAVRLLLHGSSVIDWHQLAFTSLDEVHRFLRVNALHADDPGDIERLEDLRAEAVDYLTRQFGYRIPQEVAEGIDAIDLFLLASRRGRHQTYACIVLKVMHVLHHLDGRETLFRLPVSDVQLFGLVETKVVSIIDELRGSGLPIVEFSWSRKERDSLITKLLAKKDSLAAHVFDKLRFRIVTRHPEDVPAVLFELLHRLIPFNYVIPGQTVNRLLPFQRILDANPSLHGFRDQLQPAEDINLGDSAQNDFSAQGYRIINFVADMPLRLTTVREHLSLAASAGDEIDPRSVVFILTEFQITDAATHLANEQGDASHNQYKERQHIEVKARLTRGMKARPLK